MEKSKAYQVLDGTALKVIAMVSMVIDHVGDIFFPEATWMRMAGRIAMPVFSFCIAEGYVHTHDVKRYLLRMGAFALVSELPFDLAFSGGTDWTHQNIMLSFFLSILSLILFDRVRGPKDPQTGRYGAGRTALGCFEVCLMAAVALLLRADYTCFAVIGVFLFYVLKEQDPFFRALGGVGFLSVTRTMGYYCATGLSLFPLLLYNGKKGKGLKWLFYLFYPGHLLLLYAVKAFLGR